MRRAARIDANQPEIVDGLRKAGATVQTLATVGDGCPDLLIGYRGKNYAAEVKDPNREGKKYREHETARVLTEDQHKWHFFWQGQVSVIWTIDEALELIGARMARQ